MAKAPSPEQIAAKGSEHAEQCALFAWAATSGIPQLKWMHAIPNGGERNKIVAANMKAEGQKAGVLDILLPVTTTRQFGHFAGLYIEMKKNGRQGEKNGGLSDAQVEFIHFVHSQGYHTAVCYSWQEAVKAIKGYLDV